jgi:Cobalamin-independent synthase, N-terminal domain
VILNDLSSPESNHKHKSHMTAFFFCTLHKHDVTNTTPLQTLDWVYYLGLAPPRFAGLSGLEQYFAMARGTDDIQLALDMSKYFDTNYRAPFAATVSQSFSMLMTIWYCTVTAPSVMGTTAGVAAAADVASVHGHAGDAVPECMVPVLVILQQCHSHAGGGWAAVPTYQSPAAVMSQIT